MLGKMHEFELVAKTWACKEISSCKFFQTLIKKCLSIIYVSLCPIALPWGGKTRHHWGNKRIKGQAPTSQGSCVNLSNGKQNAICTSHHRMIGMLLYNWGQWKFKWKDLRTSKNETQVHVDVGGVGTRENIESWWSWGFGLDELGAW
jgi:hypothetical protein